MDLIITWGHGLNPNLIPDGTFTRGVRYVVLPSGGYSSFRYGNPIRKVAGRGRKYDRVAVIGFSEGCHGPKNFLDSEDFGRIDAVIYCDGLAAKATDDPANRIGTSAWDAWYGGTADFARLAAFGCPPQSPLSGSDRLCVLTNSAIVPPKLVPTRTVATNILRAVMDGRTDGMTGVPASLLYGAMKIPAWHRKGCTPDTRPGREGKYRCCTTLPNQTICNERQEYTVPPYEAAMHHGNFYVLSFKNKDPSGLQDHVYQAQAVLPAVVKGLLAPRWNNNPPGGGITVSMV